MEHIARSDIQLFPAPVAFRKKQQGPDENKFHLPDAWDVTFARKHTLFYEGDSAESIYEIRRGIVKLYKTFLSGRHGVLGFFHAGDIVGLSMDSAYIYTAEAMTDVQARRIAKNTFTDYCDRNPKVAWKFLKATCHELASTQEKMFVLSRKKPAEKVAWFLLQYQPSCKQDGASPVIELPMSRADIADYLGMAPETLCRTLTQFKGKGLIAAETPYRIRLRNVQKLADIAAEACD